MNPNNGMNPIFTRVFNLIPDAFRSRSVIAGGAVVDLAKAGDIDLFVMQLDTENEMRAFEQCLRWTGIAGIAFRSDEKAGKQDAAKSDSGIPGRFNVIADIQVPNDLLPPIQICATPFMTVDDLLKDFDLSVHCQAYTQDGAIHRIPESTTVIEPIKLVHSNVPDLTLIRYRKLCKRYGLPIEAAVLAEIAALPDPANAVPVTNPARHISIAEW